MAARKSNQNFYEAKGAGVETYPLPCRQQPAPDASFGGLMNYDDIISEGIKESVYWETRDVEIEYDPEEDRCREIDHPNDEDFDDKIRDSGGPETEEEREDNND